VKVHLPLSGGNALTVTINATADPAGETTNLALFLIGIGLAITTIAAWSIQRLTRPLSLFSNAAERLGREIDAPPVPERGPSEVRQAAHAFNQMADRLRRFVRDRTTMLAAISHDLRTPITRAKLRAEFIDDEVQQKKLLADLDEMEAMIAATMSFARDDANQEPREPTDLAEMLRHIGDEMRETGKDVTINVPDALVTDCRPQAVKRVVCNLVQNAVTYGQRATVTLTADDEQIEICVEDDGPGISPEDLERVFAPFVRLEESRNRATGGVGLGLSIARSIARGHGGDLVLSNKSPHGLVARLLLPR
jgi:signal transduction histidine kinase